MADPTEAPPEKKYKYGSISLEPDFMLQMIGYGEAKVEAGDIVGFDGDHLPDLAFLNIAQWFAWVPDEIKHEIQLLASKASVRGELSMSRADRKIRFIGEFQALLKEKYEKLPGFRAKLDRLKPENVEFQVTPGEVQRDV